MAVNYARSRTEFTGSRVHLPEVPYKVHLLSRQHLDYCRFINEERFNTVNLIEEAHATSSILLSKTHSKVCHRDHRRREPIWLTLNQQPKYHLNRPARRNSEIMYRRPNMPVLSVKPKDNSWHPISEASDEDMEWSETDILRCLEHLCHEVRDKRNNAVHKAKYNCDGDAVVASTPKMEEVCECWKEVDITILTSWAKNLQHLRNAAWRSTGAKGPSHNHIWVKIWKDVVKKTQVELCESGDYPLLTRALNDVLHRDPANIFPAH